MEGKIKFAKFDVDGEKSLSKELYIESMPTLTYYKDGKIVERDTGAKTKKQLLIECMKHFV